MRNRSRSVAATWFAVTMSSLLIACGTASRLEDEIAHEPMASAPLVNSGPSPVEDELVSRVREAHGIFKPPPAVYRAITILSVRAADTFMTDCMSERGQKFAARTMQLDDSFFANPGTFVAWHTPPDVVEAKNGLGYAQPLSATKNQTDRVPYVSEDLKLSEVEQVAYDLAETDCATTLPTFEVYSWSNVNELEAQMFEIERQAMTAPGFEELEAAYIRCLEGRGFEFRDPGDLLSIVKQLYDSGQAQTKVAEFERNAAVADAECRLPIWPDFVHLTGPSWTEWLSERSDALDAVTSDWERLLADANQ